uniref:FAD/NAD(P)-binding domain-containing protein n=1 Tax=Moniliophthora roreri TaxID=221103 RepID=A0A0W0FF03_MONRR
MLIYIYAINGRDSATGTCGPDTLTSRGFVKVKPTLQLPQHPNIFAAGDIIDWNEQKQAAKIKAHVSVVLKNITSYLSGKTITNKYKGSTELIIITNGKASELDSRFDATTDASLQNGGLMYVDALWGLTFGPWVSTQSEDLDGFNASFTAGIFKAASSLHHPCIINYGLYKLMYTVA